jgi:hypothetical protein
MKRTARVILVFIGSVFLLHMAYAEEPGLGGEIVIGGDIETGRLSGLDAEEGESRVDQRNEPSDSDTYLAPYISGELNYTLPNGSTTFYITDLYTESELAIGVRQSLGNLGRIRTAGIYEDRKVWQDPYLVGVSRSRTDETSFGASFKFEDILGTHFLFSSSIMAVDVDEDRIGDREKELRRDGFRTNHSVGYTIGLDANQQFVPKVIYMRSDMEGKANSNDSCLLTVAYELGMGPWGLEASAGVGWTEFREVHPVYNKKRRSTSFSGSALLAYAEPFGWSHGSIYGLAAYHRVDENIDFFDIDLWTFELGASYKF